LLIGVPRRHGTIAPVMGQVDSGTIPPTQHMSIKTRKLSAENFATGKFVPTAKRLVQQKAW
jgi:hypothetical protein